MSTEIEVQGVVHNLEEGKWKKWVLRSLLGTAIATMLYLWFYSNGGFRGLDHPQAFEQAEIAREIARGHGFSTKFIRPASILPLEKQTGAFPVEHMPDLYQAPLWPTILAPFIWLARDTWTMSDKEIAYPSDKVVAAVATAFFLLGVLVNYLLAKRLFDRRLAVFGMGFTLLCDRLWQFSMSGLPQMLLFFLFSCAMYTLLRALQAQLALETAAAETEAAETHMGAEYEAEDAEGDGLVAPLLGQAHAPPPPPTATGWRAFPLAWLAATAVFFGLLALAHALTLWIFLGALIFCFSTFRRRWIAVGMMMAIVLLMYAPWLVRNYQVAGGFSGMTGLSFYTVLTQIRGSEGSIMRSMDPPLSGGIGMKAFPVKIFRGIYEQSGSLYRYLGDIVVAPVFFIALLHLFKRREIAVFRWGVLVMWLAAVLGMATFGFDDQPLQSNDLHLLFIPLMTLYGLAFVLMLWSRLEASHIRLVFQGFILLLFLISDRPFIGTVRELITPTQRPYQWPPYVPPYIAMMRNWTNENEIIMSDMPWAVAWYADRNSLWLPMTLDDFNELNDNRRLKAPVVGLHLTPVSGDRPFLSEIVKGDYKAWAQFIMRNPVLKNFPFHAVQGWPIDNECVTYFDRDRWTNRED